MSSPSNSPAFLLPAAKLAGCRRHRHEAMACTWEILIPQRERSYTRQVAHEAFEEIDRLERELSRFIEHSDVGRINAQPVGVPLRLGVDAFECLELAARIQADTRGAFDVTVGALLRRAGGTQGDPQSPRILQIDRPSRSVVRLGAQVQVDLGGIGKGYAVDRVADLLRAWGITAALIHSGQSTLYALGAPDEADGWEIAVRDPRDHARSIARLLLRDQAFSGSGTLVHGRHIVDPRTGRPAEGPCGAWALSASSAISDALSTAFMVLSEPEVAAYCRQHPETAALRLDAGAGSGSAGLRLHGAVRDFRTVAPGDTDNSQPG